MNRNIILYYIITDDFAAAPLNPVEFRGWYPVLAFD